MLNHFHEKGEINLLGVMCWNTERYAVSAIDAVNTFYGHPDIPIGLRAGERHETDWNHSKAIADALPHDADQSTVPEVVSLYRKLLSEQADSSLVLVTVGPLSNTQDLLTSPSDTYSELAGIDLFHKKVKEVVIMGGKFPAGDYEWNFDGGMPGVTKSVLEQLNVPVTLSGFELGESLRTGEVFNELPKTEPLYLGFRHFSEHAPWTKEQFDGDIHDNATFDQTAVLYAVRGLEAYWHPSSTGICIADSVGGNSWQADPNGTHTYLILDKPIPEMEAALEAFMLGEF